MKSVEMQTWTIDDEASLIFWQQSKDLLSDLFKKREF